MSELGKHLLGVGAVLVGAGLLLLLVGRLGWFGRLPGDLVVARKNFTFYFPVVTCLLVSALLTIIIWILNGRR